MVLRNSSLKGQWKVDLQKLKVLITIVLILKLFAEDRYSQMLVSTWK